MFGFLAGKPCGYEYQRIYAIVCQNLWMRYGRLAAFFHSYEAVFLFCLAVDLGIAPKPSRKMPTCCRLRRHAHCGGPKELNDFCSAFALLLASLKLDDDVNDSDSWQATLMRRLLRDPFQHSKRHFSSLDHQFSMRLNEILETHRRIETMRPETVTLRDFSKPTSDGFAYLFRLFADTFLEHSEHQNAVEAMGRDLGGAIIAFDCAVDWYRDRMTGNFNPLGSPVAVREALLVSESHLASLGWTLCELSSASALSTSIISMKLRQVVARRSALTFSEPTRLKTDRSLYHRRFPKMVFRRGDCDCFCPCESGGECPLHGCDADCCSRISLMPCDLCYCDGFQRQAKN